MKILTIFLISFILSSPLFAGSAGLNYTYETQSIVNMPTAGVIPKTSQLINLNFAGKSGLMMTAEWSPVTNASFGLSFGGIGIFGNEDIKFQKYPGITAKYRFLNEKKYLPAMVIGLNTQGQGNYNEQKREYNILSPGFYLALSKAFKWDYGFLAVHLGTNYSLEPVSDSKKVNIYFGCEQSLGNRASIDFEYDLNSPRNPDYKLAKGMTNIGLRYSVERNSTLNLKLSDIFGTQSEMNRTLKIEFVGYLF